MTKRLAGLALALLLALTWCTARAQVAGATEDEVKAAFLYKFLDFVQWPPEALPSGIVTIGIMGDDAVESALRRYAEMKRERTGVVMVKTIASPDQADDVQMLYVGRRETTRLPRITAALKGRPVLVVSDSPDALERGSMINFMVSDRVRFEIALDNAAKAGLHLNARLLSVAVRVKKSEGLFLPTQFVRADPRLRPWLALCFSCGPARPS